VTGNPDDLGRRYGAVVENGGFGVWEIRDDRGTSFVNAAMCDLLEIDGPGDLVGRDPGTFFAGPDPTAAPGTFAPVQVEIVGRRGGHRHAIASGAAARDGHRAWVFADVTEMRRVQERAQQAQKLEAIGRLASGIAHDFNNLLTVVYTCCGLLARRLAGDSSNRGYVEQIEAAARRGGDLTRQVLSFARDGSIAPSSVDVNDLVTKMTGLLRRVIGDDIELRANVDRSLHPVRADRTQLEQVLMNLALNARDAMPSGGKLVISTTNVEIEAAQAGELDVAPGDYVLLAVSDTGVGMDDETRAHVFEPFFTTKGGKGTGLGLATSFGIVRQTGGAIAIESAPNQGAIVRVWLPASKVSVSDAPHEGQHSAARPGTETVLLVDDDDAMRGALAEFLRIYGFTVVEARNGPDALAHAREHPGEIHVLVTDVVMPRMGGKTLAETLVALRPKMRVLYLTGHSESTVHRRGQVEAGAVVLQKPFPPEALVSRVHELLRSA
jgi:signal transduction histidine kinase